MQKSWPNETTTLSNDQFTKLVERAISGDNDALMKVLQELDQDIQHLAEFLKLPKEDGTQAIKTKFIEILREGNAYIF